jgi:Xaa-Pro aminopeptidase
VRFRAGHGLGTTYEVTLITANFPQYFGQVAPSSLNVTSDLTEQSGMLLEIHPGFFLPNVGGAAIGEMILIKDTGPECLITHPTDYMEH